MYQVKEVILRNKEETKKRLVIQFDDARFDIISNFIMTDLPLLEYKLVDEITSLLEGKVTEVKGSGNQTAWHITAKQAYIEDLFEDNGLTAVEIETSLLYDIIMDWLQQQ